MIRQHVICTIVFLVLGIFPITSQAVTVPIVEDFASDAANWLNYNSSAPLTFNASGGPDGSSYAAGTFNFQNAAVGDGPVILRGTTSILGQASGGAFFGNWLADGAGRFNVQVRHNAPMPLTYFTRFADPMNFPGGTAIHFAPVLPNTWTELEVGIRPGNPQFVTFEGMSFGAVFDNIGNVQVGVNVPAGLAGVNQEFTFDIDQASVAIPEPTTAMMLLLVGMASLLRRDRTGCNT